MNMIGQVGLLISFFIFFGSGITAAVGELAVENRIEQAELGLDREKSLRLRKIGGVGMAVAIILAIALMIATGTISVSIS